MDTNQTASDVAHAHVDKLLESLTEEQRHAVEIMTYHDDVDARIAGMLVAIVPELGSDNMETRVRASHRLAATSPEEVLKDIMVQIPAYEVFHLGRILFEAIKLLDKVPEMDMAKVRVVKQAVDSLLESGVFPDESGKGPGNGDPEKCDCANCGGNKTDEVAKV